MSLWWHFGWHYYHDDCWLFIVIICDDAHEYTGYFIIRIGP
jgi:hypothetical protein